MIRINVPYSEKEEAKKLGAMWDSENKTWYIPRNKYSNINDFQKWISFLLDDNTIIFSAPIYLAETTRKCWKCRSEISIFGICNDLTNDIYHSTGEIEKGRNKVNKDEYYFKNFGHAVRFAAYIRKMQDYELNKIRSIAKKYELRFSKTVRYNYYVNVCDHCNMLQGDFDLYHEPDSGFILIYTDKKVIMHTLDNKYDMLFSGDSVEWI